MTALRAHHRGGPEVLVVERAPVPVPAAAEALVAVHAAAITFDELTWEETWTRDGISRTPVIPSHEVSGVISEISSTVTDFKPGDEVYGLIGFDRDGAAAEFVTVPAADLAAKPSTVSHVAAAALPLAGLTAVQALVDHAAVRPGEAVLVHGGAGGVGSLTVQLAAIRGARFTATVGSDARELVGGFGAQRVIDVRTEAFDESGTSYDVVIDTVGGETLERSFGVLRRGGRLITLSAPRRQARPTNTAFRQRFSSLHPTRISLPSWPRWSLAGDCMWKSQIRFRSIGEREAFESGLETSLSPPRRAGKTVIVVRG